MIWREGDSLGIILEQLKESAMQAEWCSKTLGPFWGEQKMEIWAFVHVKSKGEGIGSVSSAS